MLGPNRAAEYSARTPVRVEFYTRSYHVSGDVEMTRWRLVDVLNDHANPFVIMESVVREPLPGFAQVGGSDLARAAQYLQINKTAILFAIPHEAPEQDAARRAYLSALYAERALVSAVAIVSPFEVRGTVHLRRPFRPRQALEEVPAEFVPMTRGEAIFLPDPRLHVAAELMVINRAATELFALAGETALSNQPGFRTP
jgi:hypothetical protein